jgi:hypothetical protein
MLALDRGNEEGSKSVRGQLMTDTEFEGTTLDGTDSVAATARRGSVLVESRDNMPARQRAVPGRTRPTEVSENLPEIGGPVAGAETTQATGQNAFVSAELARSGAGRDRASRLEFGLPRERRFRSPVEILLFAAVSIYLLGALLWEGAYSLCRLALFVVTRGAAKRTLKTVMVRADRPSSTGRSTVGRSAAVVGLVLGLLIISPGCKFMSGRWAAREFEKGFENTAWSVRAMAGTPKQYKKELAGLWRDIKLVSDPEWGQLEETFFLIGIK